VTGFSRDRVAAIIILLVLVLIASAVSVRAAPPVQDPNWPCQQRLVSHLSAAEYWNGAPLDHIGDWHGDPVVADLVQRLSPRRVSTEDGLKQIDTFAKSLTTNRQRRLALAFEGLLAESDRARADLIDKLKQIGRRQRQLADLVGQLAAELATIPANATGEAAARRADLQQRHDFSARNFEEVQRTIRYACETPIALDARLGVWARALQDGAAR
jgi:hypothetical protein